MSHLKTLTKPIMERTLKVLVKIIMAILFALCLFKMPYGYFQLVRFLGMASFIWFAYLDNEKNNKSLVILWVCSAILINPIIKISLGRTIWNIVDIIWALILLATLLKDFTNPKKNDTYN